MSHLILKFPSFTRIEISDISADISAIYRISGLIETIFDTENHLQEKSRKIGKYRRYFGEISGSDRNIGFEPKYRSKCRHLGDTRAWEIFWFFLGDISPIYRKYRRYFRYIGRYIGEAACVAQICCAENPTVQINPPFQTASLTDLMVRFESGLIQRPRFHPDLKCDPTVRFLIQRPKIKSNG